MTLRKSQFRSAIVSPRKTPVTVFSPPVNLPHGPGLTAELLVPTQHVEGVLHPEPHHLPLLLDPEGEGTLPRPDEVSDKVVNY